MINISEFKGFLEKKFPVEMIWIDEYKTDLQFIEIDCFEKESFKLAIEVSSKEIKFSTVTKDPSIDFSLYEFSFDDMAQAENFILKIKQTGVFPSKGMQ